MAAISDQQRLSHFTTLNDSYNGSNLIENQLHIDVQPLSPIVSFSFTQSENRKHFANLSQLNRVLFHVRWARPCPNIPQANFSRSSDVDNRGELAAISCVSTEYGIHYRQSTGKDIDPVGWQIEMEWRLPWRFGLVQELKMVCCCFIFLFDLVWLAGESFFGV